MILVVLVILFAVPAIALSAGVQDRYSSYFGGSGPTFRCISSGEVLSSQFVNDDFCDCSDGSDEPGTSACSTPDRKFPQHWRFQCKETKYGVREVAHSHVNDRTCDCCDGSDEPLSACPNTCAEAWEKEERITREREEARLQGIKAKETLIQSAAKKKLAMQQEKDTAELELPALAREVASAEEEKKKYEDLERTKREEIKSKSTAEHEKWKMAQEEAKKAAPPASEPQPQSSKIVCVKWHQTKDCKGNGEPIPDLDKDCQAVIEDGWSGYCECVNSETIETVKYEKDCGHRRLMCNYVCANGGDEPATIENLGKVQEEEFKIDDGSSFVLPEATDSRTKYDEAVRKKNEKDRRVQELRSELEKAFGENDVFLALSGECYEQQMGEYIYKLCPFGEVRQMRKGTSYGPLLGKWKGWGEQSYSVWGSTHDYSRMEYDQGESCWNGPGRSCHVHVVCGPETKIMSVEEPSMCTYKMVFQTPAICE